MSDRELVAVRLTYAANVLVAGTAGAVTLFGPPAAVQALFSGGTEPSPGLRVLGAFWLTVAALSGLGLVRPRPVLAVLVVQLGYKGAWLLSVAAPALIAGRSGDLPVGVAAFFAAWVVVLPLVIPWRAWLRG